jgi:TIR domain-containing protein
MAGDAWRTHVTENIPTAFVSYCRADSEFALKLAADLKAAGAGVWIDQRDIAPGQVWDEAIEEAVNQSPCMLVILSPTWVRSRNVRNELAFALDEQKLSSPLSTKIVSFLYSFAEFSALIFEPITKAASEFWFERCVLLKRLIRTAMKPTQAL